MQDGLMRALPRLDPAVPTSTSATEIAQAAFGAVIARLDYGKGDTDAQIRALPRHWRAVYTTYWLACEVENGGHHQFFWNSEGALNAETQADLDFIGAVSYASLFADAVRVYERHDYPEEKAGDDKSLTAFVKADREVGMDDLDQAFYKMPKSLREIVGEFIRSRIQLFLSSPSSR